MGMPRISNVCHSHRLIDVDAALGTRQIISDATVWLVLLFRGSASARGTRNGRESTIRAGNLKLVVGVWKTQIEPWLEQFTMLFGHGLEAQVWVLYSVG
tara:strand:- start:127 stop:423 length:297 start_codon:yes stop_codon:yes gene_type:complete